jgi:hypothetical protein
MWGDQAQELDCAAYHHAHDSDRGHPSGFHIQLQPRIPEDVHEKFLDLLTF